MTRTTEARWDEPLPRDLSTVDGVNRPYKGLTGGERQKLNIYTDSRYAFATAHIHGAIYQERRLLRAEGKTHKKQIGDSGSLTSTMGTHKVGNNRLPWTPKRLQTIQPRNNLADKTAKEVVLAARAMVTLTDLGATKLQVHT